MRDFFGSVWDERRPANAPARVWRDWVLVAVLATTAVVEGIVRSDLPSPSIVAVLVALAVVPTLLWRRTRPLLMVAIGFPICLLGEVVVGADLNLNTLAFLLILAYSLYRWGSGREAVLGSAVILSKISVSALLGYISVGDALAGVVVVSAAVAVGAAFRYRAGARQRELDQVKLLERERLARDLHDTVAHHVSAMAIRAQAGLATLHTQPTAAADALQVIEAEATRALAEMRTMVRALRRDEPADRTPLPSIADLQQLAVRARPGPVVNVELVGDVDALPPSVGTAVYRLAQESVTNARRHARHATRIHVFVAADDTSVHLRVSDDGDGATVRATGGPGYGLIGMIERADLLGGTVEAGPGPERGWTVAAVLPRVVPAG
jgi:signal transduction histidine kinase